MYLATLPPDLLSYRLCGLTALQALGWEVRSPGSPRNPGVLHQGALSLTAYHQEPGLAVEGSERALPALDHLGWNPGLSPECFHL